MRQLARTVTDQKPFQVALQRVQPIAANGKSLWIKARQQEKADCRPSVTGAKKF